MPAHSRDHEEREALRDKILGLGERSARKSYYPQLRQRIKELRQTEEYLRTIFNATNDAIFIHDAETGRILDVNEGAERMFGRALHVRPGYFAAYNNLGSIYMRRGEVDRAIRVVREAAETSPDNPFGYHTLGRLYVGIGDYEAAEGAFRRALRISRSFTEARHSLGRLYLRMGRGQDALEQFALALRYQPDDDIARNKLELIRRFMDEQQ